MRAVWPAMLGMLLACSGPGATTRTTDAGTTDPITEPSPTVPSGDVALRLHETFPTIVVATFTLAGEGEAHVEFSFEGDRRSSPVRTWEAGTHEELLLGIPYDVEVTARLVAPGGDSESVTISTPQPLDGMPEATVLAANAASYDPDSNYIFLSLSGAVGRWWALILDRQGRVVWAKRSPAGAIHLHSRPGWHGRTLLLDNNRFWSGSYNVYSSTVDRIHIDGTLVESFDVPGHHHAFTDTPTGALAYGAWDFSGVPDEQLAIATADGKVTPLWSCRAWLDGLGVQDDCGSNTVNFDVSSNSYLFSFYSLDTIVEVDASSGVATRWFGQVPGAYAFDPANTAFWWQHGGHFTSDGTLLTSSLTSNGDEIIVREYVVHTATETLEEVFSFGEGEGLLGREMGEAHRLGNGNTLHNMGSLARLREVTAAGAVVWDLDWAGREIGRSTFVRDLYELAPPRP